ncbi:MAG TPA: hypothetical protein VM510_12235 [Caulifigura sp.]|nr:hypothetical protein [Caulifigura sp.]
MRRFVACLSFWMCVSILLNGCSGTPPATPVAKLFTINGTAVYDNEKPTYYAVEVYDPVQSDWDVVTYNPIPWDEEADGENLVHCTFNFTLTTGENYRVYALSGPPQQTSSGEYEVIASTIMHQENVGVYDGSVTSKSIDLRNP